MSSFEDAIKHFKALQKRYTTQHNGKQCEFVSRALDSMGKEKRRTAGCPCCNGFRPDDVGARIYSWSVHYYEVGDGEPHYVRAKYCPLCGREINTN